MREVSLGLSVIAFLFSLYATIRMECAYRRLLRQGDDIRARHAAENAVARKRWRESQGGQL